MRTSARLTMVAAAIGACTVLATAAFAECQTVGAIGTGFNVGTAKFMADAGLKNVLEGKGLKATGPIKHTCTEGSFITECSARQQGCR